MWNTFSPLARSDFLSLHLTDQGTEAPGLLFPLLGMLFTCWALSHFRPQMTRLPPLVLWFLQFSFTYHSLWWLCLFVCFHHQAVNTVKAGSLLLLLSLVPTSSPWHHV